MQTERACRNNISRSFVWTIYLYIIQVCGGWEMATFTDICYDIISDNATVHYHTQWTILRGLGIRCMGTGGGRGSTSIGVKSMCNQYDWPSSTLRTAVSVLKLYNFISFSFIFLFFFLEKQNTYVRVYKHLHA